MKKLMRWAMAWMLLVPGLSFAEAEDPLAKRMEELKKQEYGVLDEMQVTQQENNTLKGTQLKELQQRDIDLKKEEKETADWAGKARAKWNNDDKLYKQTEQMIEKGKAEYFARGCRPGEKTPDQELAQGCNNRVEVLNTWIRSWKKQGDLLGAAGTEISNKEKQTRAKRDKLSQDTLNWTQRVKGCQSRFEDLQRSLTDIHNEMRKQCVECLSRCTDERLKHECGNIQFDGANPKLPSLEDTGVSRGTKFFEGRN